MGCYYNTCLLSNLPIDAEEKVYVFLVKRADISRYESHCETTCFYKPLLLPFIAEYDEYGAGENCRGASYQYIINSLNWELDPIEKQKFTEFNDSESWRLLSDKKLSVNNQKIFSVMIHADLLDDVYENFKFEFYLKGKIEYKTYKELFEYISEYMIRNCEILKSHVDKPYHILDQVEENSIEETVLRLFLYNKLYSYRYFTFKYDTLSVLLDMLSNRNIQKFKEFLHMCMIGFVADSMLDNVRKIWLPNMHSGSQSFEQKSYKFINNYIENKIKDRNAKYDWGADESY